MSTSLHSYPHADSSLLEVSIEFLCLSITVVQFLFTTFTGLFHKKCNRLKARVVIYAYQHHVRLLSSEPVVVMQPKCTVEGADIVMQSSPLRPNQHRRLARLNVAARAADAAREERSSCACRLR